MAKAKKSPTKKTSTKSAATAEAPVAGMPNDPALQPIETLIKATGLTPIFDPQFSFQIADKEKADGAGAAVRVLRALGERRKNRPSNFRTLSEVRTSFLPFHHFALQYLYGTIGMPKATMGTLTAQEATGKTTTCFEIMGAAMRQGCPGVYIETENKPMPVERARRCLSNNREVSEKLADQVLWTQAFSLREFEQVMIDAVDAYRGRLNNKKDKTGICVPIDTPIVIVCDVWSRLMSDAEAEGFYGYGKSAESLAKEDYTATGEGSNLLHAKWAHAFARRLPAFLSTNNVILICCNHQTEKIDMSGRGKPMDAESSALYNKTTRGGRAFNQLAAWQLTMVRAGQYKVGETVIGNKIIMRAAKQSFGPEGRRIQAVLRSEMTGDTDVFQESAMDFDFALCDLLLDNKLLGLVVENRRYTSKELGVFSGSAHDIAVAFHNNREAVISTGKFLRIEGYAEYFPEDIKKAEAVQTAGLRIQPALVAAADPSALE